MLGWRALLSRCAFLCRNSSRYILFCFLCRRRFLTPAVFSDQTRNVFTLFAYDTKSKRVSPVLKHNGLDLKSASAGPGVAGGPVRRRGPAPVSLTAQA